MFDQAMFHIFVKYQVRLCLALMIQIVYHTCYLYNFHSFLDFRSYLLNQVFSPHAVPKKLVI